MAVLFPNNPPPAGLFAAAPPPNNVPACEGAFAVAVFEKRLEPELVVFVPAPKSVPADAAVGVLLANKLGFVVAGALANKELPACGWLC